MDNSDVCGFEIIWEGSSNHNLDEMHENNLLNLFCSDEAKENILRELNGP